MAVKLGILQTGDQGEKIAQKYRSNADLFKRLLNGHPFEFSVYEVNHNHFPEDVLSEDAYLITGSQHGVYEDHSWIAPLEQFVRDCFAQKRPVVGICFGHQLMAKALGARVEKFAGGWVLGRQTYQDNGGNPVQINAFHQDQVLSQPANSEIILRSESCQIAGISYGVKGISFQGHPEMDAEFIEDLLDSKAEMFSQSQIANTRDSLDHDMCVNDITSKIVSILSGKK